MLFEGLQLAGIGLVAFTFAILWEAVWKAFALWHSARNNHKVWFVVLILVNSFGILPIVYLLWFRKK